MSETPSERWWICDQPLRLGGRKILGPFGSKELALQVRTYVEKAENGTSYWVDGTSYWVDDEEPTP